jgi:TPR repeat protein
MRRKISKETFSREEGSVAVILTCIPSDSLEEIKRKVSRRDPEAILLYGDCFMYGFKRCPIDEAKAIKLYRQAAELNSPEAMARIYYAKISKHFKLKPKRCDVNIPPKCMQTCQADNMRQMWYWLEKSAELGLFSFALRLSWGEAKKTGSWTPSQTVSHLVIRNRQEEKQL